MTYASGTKINEIFNLVYLTEYYSIVKTFFKKL
jgi:hypothetical protein